jgi:fimbrial chaperone protein
MVRRLIAALLCLLNIAGAGSGWGASLSVSPVSFNIVAPRTNGKLTLQNRGEEQVAVQIRVFRWEKKNGADHLVPTQDVVASPPMAKLKPGGKYAVRIVRVAETPVKAEESYRLLVDQLPKPVKAQGSRVSFLIRQSIPVFFVAEESQERSVLKWSARLQGGDLVLSAANRGSRRVRLSRIAVRNSAEASKLPEDGLAGYVLAGSTARWVRAAPKGSSVRSKIIITAQDEHGQLEATAIIRPAD